MFVRKQCWHGKMCKNFILKPNHWRFPGSPEVVERIFRTTCAEQKKEKSTLPRICFLCFDVKQRIKRNTCLRKPILICSSKFKKIAIHHSIWFYMFIHCYTWFYMVIRITFLWFRAIRITFLWFRVIHSYTWLYVVIHSPFSFRLGQSQYSVILVYFIILFKFSITILT